MLIDYLKYGALGLGLALAILTYRLLVKEQSQTRPRRNMLTAIYAFMFFSLALTFSGFISEMSKHPELDRVKLAELIKTGHTVKRGDAERCQLFLRDAAILLRIAGNSRWRSVEVSSAQMDVNVLGDAVNSTVQVLEAEAQR